jgi:hypothetical protein
MVTGKAGFVCLAAQVHEYTGPVPSDEATSSYHKVQAPKFTRCNHLHIISDDPKLHICCRASRLCHGLNVGHWSDLSDRPWTCEQLYVCLIHGELGFGHYWDPYQFPVYYRPLGCCFCSYGWLCVFWSAGCFVSGGWLSCLPLLTSAELALLELLPLRRSSPAAGSICCIPLAR